MVDHHSLAAGADLIADRRADFQFVARCEAESDFVLHAACDPAVFRYPGHRREAHAGGSTNYFQHGFDNRYLIYPLDVGK